MRSAHARPTGHPPTSAALRAVLAAIDYAQADHDRAEDAETDGELVRETRIYSAGNAERSNEEMPV